MKIFKHFNQSTKCPICGTNEDKKTVLIPIVSTEEGNNIQAEQNLRFHLECLKLNLQKFGNGNYIFQFYVPKEGEEDASK